MTTEQTPRKIRIVHNGPYLVEGDIRLYVYSQEMSPLHEPLNWIYEGEITPEEHSYRLCRCGHSKNLPFCDNTHIAIEFEGNETAITQRPLKPDFVYPANDGLTIRKIQRLCMASGFCIRVSGAIEDFSQYSDDPEDHKIAIKMVEDCPSSSLIYSLDLDGEDVEKKYPMQIALTREGVEDELVNGPYWVMGYVPIERSDRVPFLPRNRVTLCACGYSRQKPLCDGTHRTFAEDEISKKKRWDRY
jgi:CDGSH-type Zn-finger protein/uncharacterized Fe-S cluster protein YjdI